MDIGSILFVLALLVLTGAYVARPLAEPAARHADPAAPELLRLQARRERTLDAIQELDSDHAMGKVLDDEYQRQRRQLALRGAAVLRQIDELGGDSPADSLETALEARVAALKRQLEEAQPEKDGPQQPARYCPDCGTAAVVGDRFCSNCGTELHA